MMTAKIVSRTNQRMPLGASASSSTRRKVQRVRAAPAPVDSPPLRASLGGEERRLACAPARPVYGVVLAAARTARRLIAGSKASGRAMPKRSVYAVIKMAGQGLSLAAPMIAMATPGSNAGPRTERFRSRSRLACSESGSNTTFRALRPMLCTNHMAGPVPSATAMPQMKKSHDHPVPTTTAYATLAAIVTEPDAYNSILPRLLYGSRAEARLRGLPSCADGVLPVSSVTRAG